MISSGDGLVGFPDLGPFWGRTKYLASFFSAFRFRAYVLGFRALKLGIRNLESWDLVITNKWEYTPTSTWVSPYREVGGF